MERSRERESLGFHSIEEERHESLPVDGEIPGGLRGTLVRNGPGTFRIGGAREDDGVVLAVGLNTAEERSALHVVDGETMTELARAWLPHALPLDFHGRFFPIDD